MGYYFAEGTVQRGPFELTDLVGQGVRPETLVWTEGMADWQPAESIPELRQILRPRPNVPAPMIEYQSAPMAPVPTGGLAIASLVLGIVSIPTFCVWWFSGPCAILAVIFGLIGRSKASAGEAGGKGMATAGLVCGLVTLGLFALIIVSLLFLFVLGTL